MEVVRSYGYDLITEVISVRSHKVNNEELWHVFSVAFSDIFFLLSLNDVTQ